VVSISQKGRVSASGHAGRKKTPIIIKAKGLFQRGTGGPVGKRLLQAEIEEGGQVALHSPGGESFASGKKGAEKTKKERWRWRLSRSEEKRRTPARELLSPPKPREKLQARARWEKKRGAWAERKCLAGLKEKRKRSPDRGGGREKNGFFPTGRGGRILVSRRHMKGRIERRDETIQKEKKKKRAG